MLPVHCMSRVGKVGCPHVHLYIRFQLSAWLTQRHGHMIFTALRHFSTCGEHCNCYSMWTHWEFLQFFLQGRSHLQSALSYMSAHRVSEACALVQESGDHRLALVLAQAAGSDILRKMLTKQLANWEEQKVGGKYHRIGRSGCFITTCMWRNSS